MAARWDVREAERGRRGQNTRPSRAVLRSSSFFSWGREVAFSKYKPSPQTIRVQISKVASLLLHLQIDEFLSPAVGGGYWTIPEKCEKGNEIEMWNWYVPRQINVWTCFCCFRDLRLWRIAHCITACISAEWNSCWLPGTDHDTSVSSLLTRNYFGTLGNTSRT